MNWLKNIFSGKRETISLGFIELERWFSEKAGIDKREIIENIIGFKQDIQNEINLMKTNLELLEKSPLRESEVDRLKLLVTGNREAYLKHLNIFIKQIEPPEKSDINTLKEYTESFKELLSNLGNQTNRNYQIVAQLLGEQINNVAENIRKMNSRVKEFEKWLASDRIKDLREIEEKFKEYKNKKNNLAVFEEKLKEISEELEEKRKRVGELNNELEGLNKSAEAKQLDALTKEKDSINKEIEKIKADITENFAVLNRPLKKFQNLNKVNLVEEYLKDPFNALIKDDNMTIVGFLKEINKLIEQNKIELDDKKKGKILKTLEELDENKLKGFLSNHKTSKVSYQNVLNKILENKVGEKRELLMFRIKSTNKEIEDLNGKKSYIVNSIENNKTTDYEKDIKNKLENLYKVRINLKPAA